MKENTQQIVLRLNDAIAGLKRLSPASLQYDSILYEHFFKAMLLLQAIKASFEGNSVEQNPLIDTDLKIQVASSIAGLEAQIDETFAKADQAVNEQTLQVKEQITPEMSQSQVLELCSNPEIDELYDQAEKMIAERKLLITFIQDPAADVRLLSGTQFEQPEPVSH